MSSLTDNIKTLVVNATTTQLVLAATVTILVIWYAAKKKYNLPPGPRPLPLVGNLLAFRSRSAADVMREWVKTYGPVMTWYAGPVPMILISEVNNLTEAYVKQGSNFSGRPFIHSVDMLTEGSKDIVFANYGESWKYQRKIAVQSLRQYLTGRQLEERVHKALNPVVESMLAIKESFDPHHYISLCVFNIVHGLCFGSVFQEDDPQFKYLLDLFDEFNDLTGNGFLEDFIPLLKYWPTKKFRQVMKMADEFNAYMHNSYAEHKNNFDENDIKSLTDNIVLAQKQALEENSEHAKTMTDTHAGQIMGDMFGAGVDTTRTQLDWIVFVLAARPDIQARVQKELDDVVGDNIPSKEHRSKLVYLEAVVYETMRMFPVAPLGLPHSTLCDTKIGDYDIPANTMVMSNQYDILHDPVHWEDPESFKPERFMNETETHIVQRHASWIPFSVGQRACLGESLAKLEMVYVLAGLLQKLTFTLDPSCNSDLVSNLEGIVNRPKTYKVTVSAR